jgi:ParB-like chromosome segregation protein Spo0J
MTKLADLDQRFARLRLCSPETEVWLRGSVEREGLRESLVVSSGVESGKLVLVDGFKRVRVLSDMGRVEVPVRVMAADAAGCHAAILTLNRARRGLRDIEEAWLVRSLCRGCGMLQTEAGEILGRHKSWVCRRLRLVEHLEEWVQDEMRLGLLPAATAREIVRLPRGNQIGVAGAVCEHGLSSRQTARLVTAMLHATPEAKGSLLADPLRYVCRDEAEEEPSGPVSDPRLSHGGNRIRERLFWLEHNAHGVVDVCNGYAAGPLGTSDAELLVPLLRRAAQESERALRTIRRVIRENGGRNERRAGTPDVRGGATEEPGGVCAGDQPSDGSQPPDGEAAAEGSGGEAGVRSDGTGTGRAACPDATRVEAQRV